MGRPLAVCSLCKGAFYFHSCMCW